VTIINVAETETETWRCRLQAAPGVCLRGGTVVLSSFIISFSIFFLVSSFLLSSYLPSVQCLLFFFPSILSFPFVYFFLPSIIIFLFLLFFSYIIFLPSLFLSLPLFLLSSILLSVVCPPPHLTLNQAFHYSDECPINFSPPPFCARPPSGGNRSNNPPLTNSLTGSGGGGWLLVLFLSILTQ
jgi:hypothetical protein